MTFNSPQQFRLCFIDGSVALLNSIGAIFQFQGGISEDDKEK